MTSTDRENQRSPPSTMGSDGRNVAAIGLQSLDYGHLAMSGPLVGGARIVASTSRLAVYSHWAYR